MKALPLHEKGKLARPILEGEQMEPALLKTRLQRPPTGSIARIINAHSVALPRSGPVVGDSRSWLRLVDLIVSGIILRAPWRCCLAMFKVRINVRPWESSPERLFYTALIWNRHRPCHFRVGKTAISNLRPYAALETGFDGKGVYEPAQCQIPDLK